MRSVAFLATEYDGVLSGCQPGQRWSSKCWFLTAQPFDPADSP